MPDFSTPIPKRRVGRPSVPTAEEYERLGLAKLGPRAQTNHAWADRARRALEGDAEFAKLRAAFGLAALPHTVLAELGRHGSEAAIRSAARTVMREKSRTAVVKLRILRGATRRPPSSSRSDTEELALRLISSIREFQTERPEFGLPQVRSAVRTLAVRYGLRLSI